MDVLGYAVTVFPLGIGKPMIGILAFVGSRLRWDAGTQGSHPPICCRGDDLPDGALPKGDGKARKEGWFPHRQDLLRLTAV